MNEVIGTILEAEAEAAKILELAAAESKSAIAEGETTAEKIEKDAAAKLSRERDRVLAEAEKRAEAAYDKLLDEGRKKAAMLKKSCEGKTNAAAEEILGRVFG